MPAADTPVRLLDEAALRRVLLRYRAFLSDAGSHAAMVGAALPRIMATLALLPAGDAESRLLELGAHPYLTTLCLEEVWPGRLTLAGYGEGGRTRGTDRLLDTEGGPDRVYDFDVFNVETAEFPYPDGSFDVVVFSELIEHLALNPVWTLSEIHRVLRPGGHVIITTPNALSLDHLSNVLRGGSRSDDRYVPPFGYGARHNREWSPEELRELLDATGFVTETLTVRDLRAYDLRTRIRRAAARLALRCWSRHPRREQILVRARRGNVFYWRFPPRLFDHTHLYRAARHPFIEMGINDVIQCADGWLPLERCPPTAGPEAGAPARRVNGANLGARWIAFAIAVLRGRPDATRLTIRLCATADAGTPEVHVAFRVCSPVDGGVTLAPHQGFELPAGVWVDCVVPLVQQPRDREELEVHLGLRPGSEVLVRRLALEP